MGVDDMLRICVVGRIWFVVMRLGVGSIGWVCMICGLWGICLVLMIC